jgi:phage protein D
MEMREGEGGLSAIELRFSNVASDPEGGAALAFEDESILALGSRITVYTGDEGTPQEVFSGVVTGFEAEFSEHGPPELLVLAEDRFQQARMTRRTAIHRDFSIADLVQELASRLGIQAVVTGLDETLDAWLQLNESDLSFLRRLLLRHDGDMQLVGDELHASPRSEVQRGSLTLELYGQLRQARAVADLSHQVTEVTVSGWDPLRGQRASASSDGVNLGPGSGRSGSQLLREAIGDRSEHIGHLAVLDDGEAQLLADAAFDQVARRFVCVAGTAEGNPGLRVGTHLELRGLSNRLDNTYYVTTACHRYDVARGYETDFEAESAWLGAA